MSAEGEDKYDDLCELIHEQAKARGALGVVLIVPERDGGSAITVHVSIHTEMDLHRALPAMLLEVAERIEQDTRSKDMLNLMRAAQPSKEH